MSNQPNPQCQFKRVEELENTAKQFGFYWEHIDELLEQIRSECAEVDESWQKNDRAHLQEEIGDLLLAAVSLAIFCDLDPRETLRISTDKYQKRYDAVVKLAKLDGHDHLRQQPMSLLMHYWNKAKQI